MKEKIIKLLYSKNHEDWAIANELIIAHKIDILPEELNLVKTYESDRFYSSHSEDIYIKNPDLTWFKLSSVLVDFDKIYNR